MWRTRNFALHVLVLFGVHAWRPPNAHATPGVLQTPTPPLPPHVQLHSQTPLQHPPASVYTLQPSLALRHYVSNPSDSSQCEQPAKQQVSKTCLPPAASARVSPSLWRATAPSASSSQPSSRSPKPACRRPPQHGSARRYGERQLPVLAAASQAAGLQNLPAAGRLSTGQPVAMASDSSQC